MGTLKGLLSKITSFLGREQYSTHVGAAGPARAFGLSWRGPHSEAVLREPLVYGLSSEILSNLLDTCVC